MVLFYKNICLLDEWRMDCSRLFCPTLQLCRLPVFCLGRTKKGFVMFNRSRDILMLSMALFFLVSTCCVVYATHTVLSEDGKWVGGVVRHVVSDKGKGHPVVERLVDRVTDKILSRVLAKDERLHVLPLVEKILDRILHRLVQKLFSNEGDVLFKGIVKSPEVEHFMKKVVDHVLMKRQTQLVAVVKKVAPVDLARVSRGVVSHVLRRERKPLIAVVSRLVGELMKQSSGRGGGKALATAVIDRVFAKHQKSLTEILQKVAPLNLKTLTQKLVQQILNRNRKDIADIAQSIIVKLTKKIRQGDVEKLTKKLLTQVIRRHKQDIVDIVRRSNKTNLEKLLPRVTKRVLRENKKQIVYIVREVLRVDFAKLLKQTFSKKK